VADVDEGGDRPPQIEQRVQLHGRLGGAKRRPWEHRQAQIDGRGAINARVGFKLLSVLQVIVRKVRSSVHEKYVNINSLRVLY
jgi:hypothetical protein